MEKNVDYCRNKCASNRKLRLGENRYKGRIRVCKRDLKNKLDR